MKKIGLPAYAQEYLKMKAFENAWGKYHCTHILASNLAYKELRAQRERFRLAIEREIANLPTDPAMGEVKEAVAAFEKQMDRSSFIQSNKTRAKIKKGGR